MLLAKYEILQIAKFKDTGDDNKAINQLAKNIITVNN